MEKKIGKYAVKNLIFYVLGAYVIGYLFYYLDDRLGIYQYITLEPAMVMKGQVWRLFTWVCTPPQALSIWVIFMFLLYFFIGRSLESTMGTFRYNLYIFSGWLFTTLGAMIIYWITSAFSAGVSLEANTYYINLASFLAFALLFPDHRVYFFGIIPIRMKILAWIDLGYLILEALSDLYLILNKDLVSQTYALLGYSVAPATIVFVSQLFSILISLLNFFIFFFINRKHKWQNDKRKNAFRREFERGRNENQSWQRQKSAGFFSSENKNEEKQEKSFKPDKSKALVHRCTICGRTNIDNPDLVFRYCSKCSGEHEYCQDHLFTHEHIKE